MSRKKVLLVFDKFRDTISARDICNVLQGSITHHLGPDIRVHQMPISDGGDGFIECMSEGLKENPNVTKLSHQVLDPLLRPVLGSYLMNRLTNTAFIEVANVSGNSLLSKKERNPFVSSSIVRYFRLILWFIYNLFLLRVWDR
jgi:glycerate kinase